MSDWIPSQAGVRNHPKTRRAARRLDVPVPHLVGYLHCLWWWALEYAPDGDVEDFEPQDLADAAGWEEDPEEFVQALIDAGVKGQSGFLERVDGRLVIHDWEDNQGSQFRSRVLAANRKRREREAADSVTPAGDHVTDERDTVTDKRDLARAKDRPTGPTGPTGQDRPTGRAQAREAAASFPQEAELQSLAAISGYPFNHEQDTARLEEFAAEAPDVDLVLEFHKIRDWIADKRKPPKNWRLFVRNWVIKAQKEADEQKRRLEPPRPTPPTRPRLPPVTEEDLRRQGEEAAKARSAVAGLARAMGMPA